MAVGDRRAHVDEAAELLRRRGYRLTPQRLWVLAALLDSEEHVTAEQVLEYVRGAYLQMNPSTVYRTLELLRDGGLATETDLGDGRVRYHPRDKARHHHLVCGKCGATTEVEDSLLQSLREVLVKDYQFRASLNHLAIQGECKSCRQQPLIGRRFSRRKDSAWAMKQGARKGACHEASGKSQGADRERSRSG